jgi:hypothetical protein
MYSENDYNITVKGATRSAENLTVETNGDDPKTNLVFLQTVN